MLTSTNQIRLFIREVMTHAHPSFNIREADGDAGVPEITEDAVWLARISGEGPLRRGDEGPAVMYSQIYLKAALKIMSKKQREQLKLRPSVARIKRVTGESDASPEAISELESTLDLDGKFGRRTQAATLAFQDHAGISVDGRIGPITAAALIEFVKSGGNSPVDDSDDDYTPPPVSYPDDEPDDVEPAPVPPVSHPTSPAGTATGEIRNSDGDLLAPARSAADNRSGYGFKDNYGEFHLDKRKRPCDGKRNCNPYRAHPGIDISCQDNSLGTPLVAVFDGEVSDEGYDGGAGNFVKLKSGNLEVVYKHMKESAAVSKGDRVMPGQRVGLMGSTGISTGPHLHFGVKESGKWIEPMNWIRNNAVYYPISAHKYPS